MELEQMKKDMADIKTYIEVAKDTGETFKGIIARIRKWEEERRKQTMLFKKNKEKLENTKEKCINELLNFNEILIESTIRKLYEIQDIQQLGIMEQEKDKHRNVIINTSVKELMQYSDKIKELVRDCKSKY